MTRRPSTSRACGECVEPGSPAPGPDHRSLRVSRSYLQEVQYASEGNLAARQSIYAFQHPRIDLHGWALDLGGLGGDERVLDCGCGNGIYPERLAARGHQGPIMGVDLSLGMLKATAVRVPGTALAVADLASLPLADGSFDVVLAMHVLYHLPDGPLAVQELRRVLAPGGTALCVTNSSTHLHELYELIRSALSSVTGTDPGPIATSLDAFRVENGADLLAKAFDSVEVITVHSELVINDPGPVVAYATSMRPMHGLEQPVVASVNAEIARLVEQAIATNGAFRTHTSVGCFRCR